MKKKQIILPALACLILYSACKKSEKKTTSSPHYISFTMPDGTFYKDTLMQCEGAVGTEVQIGASTKAGTFMLWFKNYTGTIGTYPLDNINQRSYVTGIGISDPLCVSVHGSLTITAVSPDIIGSFVYTRADSGIVSGAFNAPTP
ncbi:MAG: hypothetical protein JWQ38_2811 [Flavipsychrobacter sp.]|nr:hypothetical protein [Flavipsychrobacter sp.]